MLAKWIWKLEDEDGIWQDIIESKYLKDKCLSGVKYKKGGSQFCSSLLKIRGLVYPHIKKKLGDGRNTRFRENWWVDDKSLKEAYPSLYFISNDREITIREVIDRGWGLCLLEEQSVGDMIISGIV